MPDSASLYTRLGGYDAIAAVVDDLLPRLRSDELLSRFWTSPRSVNTHNRERQLAVDFIAAAAGGPTIYLGRDMKMSHKGMGITKADYTAFMRCLGATMDKFEVREPERSEVVAFATSLEPENRGGVADHSLVPVSKSSVVTTFFSTQQGVWLRNALERSSGFFVAFLGQLPSPEHGGVSGGSGEPIEAVGKL